MACCCGGVGFLNPSAHRRERATCLAAKAAAMGAASAAKRRTNPTAVNERRIMRSASK